MSPFEEFFTEAFQRELEEVVVPPAAFSTPPTGPVVYSWDRKAAWLLFAERRGLAVEFARREAKTTLTEDGY